MADGRSAAPTPKPRIIPPQEGGASGRLFLQEQDATAPLLACIHGGGCHGGYFDIKGHSTLDAALKGGFSVLLVDRPGYAGSGEAPETDDPVRADVPAVGALIERALASGAPKARGLCLLGHSIGGAITLELAGEGRDWPLLGIAVSGVGDEAPEEVLTFDMEAFLNREGLAPETAAMFLGPEGTYGWQAISRFRRVSHEWRANEAEAMMYIWPLRWPELAGKVDVPVHLRLAEHERIWVASQEVVDRMAARLTRSPRIDAAVLKEGGHLYELHKRGPELIASQMAFFADCSARAAPELQSG